MGSESGYQRGRRERGRGEEGKRGLAEKAGGKSELGGMGDGIRRGGAGDSRGLGAEGDWQAGVCMLLLPSVTVFG